MSNYEVRLARETHKADLGAKYSGSPTTTFGDKGAKVKSEKLKGKKGKDFHQMQPKSYIPRV